jgi:copper chaperone
MPDTLELTVPSIVCDRCVQAVTQAIQGVDAQAQVQVNLETKQVSIKTIVEREVLKAAIDEAGHEVA